MVKISNNIRHLTIAVFLLTSTIVPFGYANALSDFNFTMSNVAYQSTITAYGANVTYLVTAQNNGINVSSIGCDPVSGSLFTVGDTPVICTATDNQGVTATVSFIITVGGTDSTSYPIIHMQDTTATGGYSTFSGRPIHAEYVTSSSQLVGDKIDTITLRLSRLGSPTGFAEIGVFNSDLSVKKLFGTKDVSTISLGYSDYTFALGPTDLYTIQSGDRIGIKYTGGDTTNIVKTMRDGDSADPFDGVNSYRVYYITSWVSSFTAEDLTMTLKQTH